jgi:hypothetical protein
MSVYSSVQRSEPDVLPTVKERVVSTLDGAVRVDKTSDRRGRD